MGWKIVCCTLLGVLLWGLTGVPGVADQASPAQLVRHLLTVIQRIKSASNGALSEADLQQNRQVAQELDALLDIPGVSQRTLAQHWEALSPEERQEFTLLLTQLFAKVAYPKSAEFFQDLEVTVTDERTNGESALVNTTVSHPEEGLIAVDYRLQKRDGNWYVHDILLDDVSLTLNLRAQFNKIITENSYAELVKRMRDKLAE